MEEDENQDNLTKCEEGENEMSPEEAASEDCHQEGKLTVD